MPLTERRAAQRYPVVLPVTLEDGSGQTRDISLTGTYILSRKTYPVNSNIVFSLQFDRIDPDTAKPLFFACRGQVLRAEPQNGLSGVAVRFLDDSGNKPFSVTVGRETDGNFFSQMLVNMATSQSTEI